MSTIASLALASASGCLVGDVDGNGENTGPTTGDTTPGGNATNPGTPGGNGNAKAIFDGEVRPLMDGCASAGCHGDPGSPAFLGASKEQSYAAIKLFPSLLGNYEATQATLISYVAGGAHKGQPAFTEAQIAIFAKWFQAEKEAAVNPDPDTGGGPIINSKQAYATFSGCMTKANWDQANMIVWANKGTTEGACSSCHTEGAFRIYINPDSDLMFNMNRTETFLPGFFTVTVNVDGNAEVVPATSKLKSLGQGTDPGSLHPRYNTNDNDQAFQALQQFYNLTKAAVEAGNCPEQGFPTPPAAAL